MFVKIEKTLPVFAVQEVHQVFFFFDKTCFGQFPLELAQNLLLAQTLPPEFDKDVNLFVSWNSFYAFSSLTIVLINTHLNKSAHSSIASDGGRSGACI